MRIEIITEKYKGLETCEKCPLEDKCFAESMCELLDIPEDEHIVDVKKYE